MSQLTLLKRRGVRPLKNETITFRRILGELARKYGARSPSRQHSPIRATAKTHATVERALTPKKLCRGVSGRQARGSQMPPPTVAAETRFVHMPNTFSISC